MAASLNPVVTVPKKELTPAASRLRVGEAGPGSSLQIYATDPFASTPIERSFVRSQHHALLPHISAARLASFRDFARDLNRALALYVWDRELSAAFFSDIAVLEVALRNAIDREFVHDLGTAWYQQLDLWDARTRRRITQVLMRLGRSASRDQVVSEQSFGFWLDLLGSGGMVNSADPLSRVSYETLWRNTLHRAFPGARAEARALGVQATRNWVHEQVAIVGALRNRVAHHHPLIFGIPKPGLGASVETHLRLSPEEAHTTCIRVAAMIDRDLAAWMLRDSKVPALLATRP